MDLFRRGDGCAASRYVRCINRACVGCATLGAVLVIGCASPGPPRAPSLNLPQPVRDLTATRMGDVVELRFTPPSRTTDKLPLSGGTTAGQLCRQLEQQPCVPVAASKTTIAAAGPNNKHDLITWTDTLPASLMQGRPRLLGYRVEFFSPAGRSAGASAPAFTATGPSPAPVGDLHAEGSRLGVVLGWNASGQPGDVLLEREDLGSARAKEPKTSGRARAALPRIVWLGAHDPTSAAPQQNRTLDTTATPDTPYRYSALRRITLQLGGHSIELRSALSAPILFTLREIYPPPAPTGLSAVGFFVSAPSAGATSTFAVDLIWQPVDDAGLLAGLAGYNVYRAPLNSGVEPAATGGSTALGTRLNATPVPVPAFHDTTANSTMRYHYSVTAVDAKGNESRAVAVLLEPSSAP